VVKCTKKRIRLSCWREPDAHFIAPFQSVVMAAATAMPATAIAMLRLAMEAATASTLEVAAEAAAAIETLRCRLPGLILHAAAPATIVPIAAEALLRRGLHGAALKTAAEAAAIAEALLALEALPNRVAAKSTAIPIPAVAEVAEGLARAIVPVAAAIEAAPDKVVALIEAAA
jgi:hypothetical protein